MLARLHTLQLREPFRIAHGVSLTRTVLRVSRLNEEFEALGEAPFVPYYTDAPGPTLAWVSSLPTHPDSLPADCPRTARVALDLLRLDSQGKRSGKPIGALFDIPPVPPKPACHSLSIPSNWDAFHRRLDSLHSQFSIFKLKLGSGSMEHDLQIVQHARAAASTAVFFADANGGWSPPEALQILPKLAELGVAFVEQPVAHSLGIDAWKKLRQIPRTEIPPLYADESVQSVGDIYALGEWVDGINIKLLKFGGFEPALEGIRAARSCGLRVLLGCMIESSIGTTAAAHLAPLADWIDLDGHLWVLNDDYEGLRFDPKGRLLVPELPGIGVRKKETP